MAASTGTSRYTTDWDSAKKTKIPWVSQSQRQEISEGFINSWALEKQIENLREGSLNVIKGLGVKMEEVNKDFCLINHRSKENL